MYILKWKKIYFELLMNTIIPINMQSGDSILSFTSITSLDDFNARFFEFLLGRI